jgi:hypothetical protein
MDQGLPTELDAIQPSTASVPLPGLVACGAIAGALLGAINALIVRAAVGIPHSADRVALHGVGLGALLGILFPLVRRRAIGPDGELTLATPLGGLYGAVPALAVLYQVVIVNRVIGVYWLAAMAMVGVMVGLIVGSFLDRCFEAALVRRGREGGLTSLDRGQGEDRPRPRRGDRVLVHGRGEGIVIAAVGDPIHVRMEAGVVTVFARDVTLIESAE